MALAKERIRQNPPPAFSQGIDPSSLEFFIFKGHHHASMMLEEGSCSEGQLPTTSLFDPSSSSSSVLSFEQPKLDQEEKCALWIDTMDREYQPSCVPYRLGRDANCFEMASG